MLSGIGPADHLREHGIAVVADLPGVGQNLIDHPEVPIIANANGPYGYFKQGVGWRMIRNGLQFKLFGSGPILSAGVEAGAFVNPDDPCAEPTIQAFCVPIVYLDRDTLSLVENTYGLTVTTVVVKPKSRGEVRLRSANPADKPLVSPNLLLHPDDMAAMIAGQRFFVRAFQTGPLASRIKRLAIPDPAAAGRRDAGRSLPPFRQDQLSSRPRPRGWGRTAIRWRCWMRGCACAGSRACASPTCPPCPTSMPATRTHRR
jgi:choline dehydrogenase